MSSWTEIPTLPPLSVLHIVGRMVWRRPGGGHCRICGKRYSIQEKSVKAPAMPSKNGTSGFQVSCRKYGKGDSIVYQESTQKDNISRVLRWCMTAFQKCQGFYLCQVIPFLQPYYEVGRLSGSSRPQGVHSYQLLGCSFPDNTVSKPDHVLAIFTL